MGHFARLFKWGKKEMIGEVWNGAAFPAEDAAWTKTWRCKRLRYLTYG